MTDLAALIAQARAAVKECYNPFKVTDESRTFAAILEACATELERLQDLLENHGPEGHNVTNAQWVVLLKENETLLALARAASPFWTQSHHGEPWKNEQMGCSLCMAQLTVQSVLAALPPETLKKVQE